MRLSLAVSEVSNVSVVAALKSFGVLFWVWVGCFPATGLVGKDCVFKDAEV